MFFKYCIQRKCDTNLSATFYHPKNPVGTRF